jgi:hypothetical protein
MLLESNIISTTTISVPIFADARYFIDYNIRQMPHLQAFHEDIGTVNTDFNVNFDIDFDAY